MRVALIAFAIVAAALATSTRPSSAQYNARYCTDGGGPGGSGAIECAYLTWAQCLAAASGLGMHCLENPAITWGRAGYPERRRPGRRYND
jgi:hypothetical protein